MTGAAAIGRSCALDLNFERYRFPGFTVPERETPFSYLYQRAHEGLRVRYRPITRQSVKQLAHELEIIERTNLAEFFLIVWDLMEFARRNGIIGQGRGSAGDSIVAYCLGITKVDPIAHKLLFERFINEARTLPDIDIDFDVNRREEVIQYLYQRYGEDHAAMVCTVITYRARSAVREVAKALDFPPDAIDTIAKALDTHDATDLAGDLALDGSFGWLFEELGTESAALPTAPLVGREADSSWNGRGRPALRPDLAAAEERARDAAGDHDGRPYSESGWYPPRRPGVLDASVTQVRHEGWQQKRYGPGGLRQVAETTPPVVRVDPESGMPIEERRRPSVVPSQASFKAAHSTPRNRWQWLLALCAEIDGFPRHLGIHVGGMLVTRTPLIDLVPIERAAMPNRVVTQYDKEDIEALGLVKIDLLSLRTLGVVSECLDKIERDTGERIDLDALPHDDPEVYKTIRAADTVGMFQIESRAQMQALPKSRPERFEDLVVQVAIIRPGPIQGNAVHPYLRRRAGTEPVTYLHPSLQPILEDTLGVILYQEQVMQIAMEVCGYTALEADIFRKAMGSHRSHAKMQAERDRFVGGAMRTGLTEEDGEDLFRRCSAFAEFGFARAHAAAFAKITYDTAWLKQRYPAYYYVGVLNNQPMGFYSPAVIVGDAKRHGVKVLPVDVNASRWEHEVERLPGGNAALRLGMRQVKGIDSSARETLERERAIGPYTSVRDFVARTGQGEQVVERLIVIGAFDWTDAPRRELLWQLRSTVADADPQRPALGLTDDAQRELGATLPPMTFAERIAADYRELGLSPTAHAVELFRARLTQRGVLSIAEAGKRRNRSRLRLAGLAVSIQHPMTAKNFVFIALEDETGMINVTVRPQVYTAHRAILHRNPLLVIDGVLQVEGEVLNVVAQRIHPVAAVIAEEERETRVPLAKQQRLFR
jgi:error-prone DNA polymerase